MTQLDAVIPILPRETQVVHELAAVLVRILIRQGVAEGFAFPTPGQAFVERVVDRAWRVEVVGIDVIDQRFAGVAAVGAHHRNRRVAQPEVILARALRGRVGMFRQQVAGFVVDELDRFAVGGLDRQLPLPVIDELLPQHAFDAWLLIVVNSKQVAKSRYGLLWYRLWCEHSKR